MAWIDDLPNIKRENEEWREKYLPRLREKQRLRDLARKEALTLWHQLTEDQRKILGHYCSLD